MKRVALLPNVVTAFGLSCGLFVIFKLSLTPFGQADYPVVLAAAGILLLAAVADLLDGIIARMIKAESEFGGLFDSLADAISFGVAPSVVVLKTLSIEPGTDLSFFLTSAAMVFSVCGVLRLVRFNVLMAAPATPESPWFRNGQKNFIGLPIPAAAAVVVSTNLFLLSPEAAQWFAPSPLFQTWMLFAVFLFIGYLMVSRWRFFSLKALHIRVRSFSIVFVTVLLAVLLFYGILSHFAVVFFLVSWAYIVLASILSLIRIIAGRRSNTLEDFEPSDALFAEEEKSDKDLQ